MQTPRVAWLSAETPDRHGNGGQRRQFHQVRALAQAGIEVHVASAVSEQDDTSVRAIAPVTRIDWSRWNRYHRRADRALYSFLRRADVGAAVVAHLESVRQMAPALRRAGIPWLLDFHNVNSRWAAYQGDHDEARAWKSCEQAAVRMANAAVCCSAEERNALQEIAPGATIRVAPHGVDPDEWPDNAVADEREQSVVIFGNWFHAPNTAGAHWFMSDVWPSVQEAIPASRLLLAGSGNAPEPPPGCRGIVDLGRVPDLAQVLGRATVVAVPIVRGIGARMKFPEALASGAAVVSTPLGAQGPEASGRYIEAGTAETFASACVHFLSDVAGAASFGRAAREYALANLSWDGTTRPIIEWAEHAAKR